VDTAYHLALSSVDSAQLLRKFLHLCVQAGQLNVYRVQWK